MIKKILFCVACFVFGMSVVVYAGEDEYVDECGTCRVFELELELLCDDEIVMLFAPFSAIIHEINEIYGTNIMPAKITDEDGRYSMIQALVAFTPESFWGVIEEIAANQENSKILNPLYVSLFEAFEAGEMDGDSLITVLDGISVLSLLELEEIYSSIMEGKGVYQAFEMVSPRVIHTITTRTLTSPHLGSFILTVDVSILTWTDGATTYQSLRYTSNLRISLTPGTTGQIASTHDHIHRIIEPGMVNVFVWMQGVHTGPGFRSDFIAHHTFRNVV